MNYKIGDTVWYAQLKSVTKSVKCPDCFGDKFLTVIKGDSSQVTIDCAGCSSGYNPPNGYVNYTAYEVAVTPVVIERKEETSLEVRYGASLAIFDTKWITLSTE